MKIRYCTKYEKYVSQYNCEIFNEGTQCPHYSSKGWTSIRELINDPERPKWIVGEVIKPVKCSLLNRDYYRNLVKNRSSSRVSSR